MVTSEAALQSRIQSIGREIFERARAAEPSVYQQGWWQQRFLDWAMHDPEVRVRLFRFIDVLPVLRSSAHIGNQLVDYLSADGIKLTGLFGLGLTLGSLNPLSRRVMGAVTRYNVRRMARRFIAGETADQVIDLARRLRRRPMTATIDPVGEATTSESQADAYAERSLRLIDALADAAGDWPRVPQIDEGPNGEPLPRVNVSLKLSSLDSQFDPIAPGRSTETVSARLRPILQRARERGAFINIDMEQFAYKDLTLAIFKSILEEDELRDLTDVGIVIQAYLKDSERDLRGVIEWARRRGRPIGVRLVKGAYWDHETIMAVQRRWPCPVFTSKWESDVQFERLTRLLIENHEWVRPAIASHNVRSLATAIAHAERRGLSNRDFELQMLYGMGDPLKTALIERGHRLRVYTPYGPLIPGMGYLIRRLLENTSNDSFLRQSFAEHVPLDELLADPDKARPPSAPVPAPVSIDPWEEETVTPFNQEPLSDFSLAENRDAMQAALESVRALCGAHYPAVINGEKVESERSLDSVDPAQPSFVIGKAACATSAQAERAVAAAREAWPEWGRRSVEERATILRRLAELMRVRRFELAAWMILESGKPWREADGDVAEAIDFCEFYAGEMERLDARPRQRHVPGEENVLVYEPRGVALVIAPWNFPLAILTGMTTAALVTGNTVIMKPAEQSPVIAAKLFEMLCEAGVPAGAVNFVPGIGEEVGAHLVAHADVDLIAFTGSRAVGLDIIKTAAQTRPDQTMVKKVIAEMGGKNAIIVDADADLDEAVKGVIESAFGYAGQKCSACSRVIAVASIHDDLVRRLADTLRSLRIGHPSDPATTIGPLIDDEARRRVDSFIERGRGEASVACRVEHGRSDGYFVDPTIFDGVDPHATIAQEEIFGPVLAVIAAKDFDEALAIANDTDYALTGGVYSRSPAHLERARRDFRVGNLYLNRSITGAQVDRHPFGGFKMSGIGSKAGGPDYLQQFCEPKTITEDTIRQGFAPTDVR